MKSKPKPTLPTVIKERRQFMRTNRGPNEVRLFNERLQEFCKTATRAFRLGFTGTAGMYCFIRNLKEHEKQYRFLECMERDARKRAAAA